VPVTVFDLQILAAKWLSCGRRHGALVRKAGRDPCRTAPGILALLLLQLTSNH